MIGDIRRHLAQSPFQPFTIHMADGRHIDVPTHDHVTLSVSRAYINRDDESSDTLPGLLMAGLTIHAPGKRE